MTATDIATGAKGSEATTVIAAAAKTIVLNGLPSTVMAGSSQTLTVTALDPFGNVATSYTGTIHFTGSDPKEVLPPNYTFRASDGGSHTFTGVFF